MTVEFGHMKYRVLVFARNCNVVRRKKFVIILPKRAENPKLNPNPNPNGNPFLTPTLKVEKVHALDIVPLRNESPPQKRSGMARVLKGFHHHHHHFIQLYNRKYFYR